MRNTTTDRFTEKQSQIEKKRLDLVKRYPALWSGMVEGWRSDSAEDAVWLMYSANYLLRTGGVHWAIDPYSLKRRVPAAPAMDVGKDLEALSFVLLTHDHKDHLDPDLIKALRDLPIRWVVPSFMVENVQRKTGLASDKIIVPTLLQPLELDGMTVMPFESQHLITRADGTRKGVPELGYLVKCGGKRWLFPGDTRVYDLSRVPKFGEVDAVFAHLWLGHGWALDPDPDLIEEICRFFAGLQPRRLLITHLEEFGRDADDFFDEEHAEKVMQVYSASYPQIDCSFHFMGEKILL